jgi:hypothetical protein
MADTLFLQFYNEIKGSYFDLCNGFSDTYDLCKEKGEFYWTEHEVDYTKWYLEGTYTNRKLPIDRGTIYVSALYVNHLYQAYVWAREHPDIEFIVGGPVAAESRIDPKGWNPIYLEMDTDEALPSNLTVTGKSVEDWFGVPNFSGKWKLELPEYIPNHRKIYFSYTLDNKCYWSRCTYCNLALFADELFRKRKHMGFEFRDLTHNGSKIVRLNTASITPKHIRELLPDLPCGDDIEYRVFMRPATAENDALEEVFRGWKGEIPNLMFGIGMEFPSSRMLKYVCKGFDKAEMLESLRICNGHGIRVNANFILGWNNLIENDLRELEDFMDRIPESSLTNLQLRWLLAHPFTKIHDTCEGEPIRLGPFYLGFRVEVSEKQMALNLQAAEIIKQYAARKHFKVEGLRNLKKT